MPEDEITAARERLELVVADGLKIFSAGRVDESMQIADQAVAANPHSKAALSLKAMCHERRGEISDAIECHERVLDLDPDSMIDRIKVKDLRNLLVTRSSIAAVPDRRMAIAGAVAAFVLVASIGVLAARTANRDEVPQKLASNITSSELPNSVQNTNGQLNGGQPSTGVPGGGTAQQSQQDQHGQQPSGGQDNPGAQQPSGTRPLNERSEIQLPNAPTGGSLPRPTSMPDRGDVVGPIVFSDKDIRPILNQKPPAKQTGVSNPPTNHDSDPPPTEDKTPTQQPVKRDAPGIMEIKVVSRGGQPTDGGSAPTSGGGNGVEALMRTARQQYQLGNWASAAQSFERALRAGGDPASGNQRLAQCYEKLGRNSEAVAAYNRAIDAFQSALSSGSGDKDRIQSALDSCRQAVKVLGG